MNSNLDARGTFYLGRREADQEPLLYDSRDLTTHAVCVGMTGSGKTGLCLSLLEEAALDGVPAICIDPKGDLGNLALTFPQLRPEDFVPWIDPADAARRGVSVEERAAGVAETWREGLAAWGQSGERVARFRDAAEVAIYTPGSSAGLPLSVLERLSAPPPGQDAEAVRERVQGAVSGLLALVGVAADPVQSREHVFLSNVVQHFWSAGTDLELGALVHAILEPPMATIGVLDVDAFFGKKERQALAMKLNALLASPSFAGWMQGEPLDIARLLWTPEGRPRISILSIAHLSDAERMFFVTLVLGELVAWMRSQAGTSDLRALLYMDEVVGFLPPVAKPPSKAPLMTLLKQARAFGVGCVLATQNPVDVDYKALSNCGTWFLGRLQTERDVDRVIDGLEGASQLAGQRLESAEVRRTLAGLSSRVFLMNDVHREGPELFHSRWALSYLRGPLTRSQIATLMADHPARERAAATAPTATAPTTAPGTADAAPADATLRDAESPMDAEIRREAPLGRPPLPDHLEEIFVAGEGALLRPHLLGVVELAYSHARAGVSHEFRASLVARVDDSEPPALWKDAWQVGSTPTVPIAPPNARFAPLPAACVSRSRMRSIEAALKSECIARFPLVLGQCRALKLWSRPEETREAFAARVEVAALAARDRERSKAREKNDRTLAKAEARIDKLRARLERETEQADSAELDTGISVGSAVLGAIFGNGTLAGNARRATRSAKKVRRASAQKTDVRHARAALTDAEQEFESLGATLEAEVAAIPRPATTIEEVAVRPKRADARVERLVLAWVPE